MRKACNSDGFFLVDASGTSWQSKSQVFFLALQEKRRAARVGKSKKEELEAQLEEDSIENLEDHWKPEVSSTK